MPFVDETISMFWKIYIVDALLGNFDRHGSNWGFLKRNYQYSLAPIFDNGSCLFPNLNRLEWLIRTNLRYSGDLLYVKPIEEKRLLIVEDVSVLDNRSAGIMRRLLEIICCGGIVKTSDFLIDDSNRKQFYSLLKAIYVQEKKYIAQQKLNGVKAAAEEGRYKGRGKIKIDETILMEVMSAYACKKITGEEAARRLQISLSTFNRRYKEGKKV